MGSLSAVRRVLAGLALLVAPPVLAEPAEPPPDVVERIYEDEESLTEDEDLVQQIEEHDPSDTIESTESADADIVESIPAQSDSEAVEFEEHVGQDEPTTERFKLSGWFLESIEWTFEPNGVGRDDDKNLFAVSRDRAVSRTQLLLRSSYQRGRSFEATASGLLHLGLHGDADIGRYDENGATDGNVWVFPEAQLRELYVGFFFDDVDLRLGQQRLAWGRTDVFSPNDIANARDLRNPFLTQPELRFVPTPMARLDIFLGALTLQGIVSPVFVPDRAVLYGTNWAAVQPSTPAQYRALFNLINRAFDPSLQEQINGALQQTRLPNRNGEGVSAGGKVGLRLDGLDLNAYYHYGYDGLPYLYIDPAFEFLLQSTDFENAGFADLAPVLTVLDAGFSPIIAEYVRRHHAGLDVETALGPFVFRLDAAYQSQRVFYRVDLTSTSIPTVLAVAGIEYQTGSVEKTLIVEAVYIRLLEPYEEPLLMYDRDSYGFSYVLRWPLFGSLSMKARGMLGARPRFYTAQPSLGVELDGFDIDVGALLIGGDARSLGGYFTNNDAGFVQVRRAF